MSFVSNTGLAHYHDKMKTLLNGKANTNHTHNYAGSSSVGGSANSAIKLTNLAGDNNNVGFYDSTDTHILQLGYMQCTSSYDNLTLLISSSFYGAQHGSTDIINIYQDRNADDNVHPVVNRVRMGSSRDFYYTIDNTNKRLYIYAKVTGGNSYGRWLVSTLQIMNASWVTELKKNQTITNAKTISEQLALSNHDHSFITNSEIDAMF